MDIPVYLIAGFLDAGKTEFINGILRDGFAAEDRTLLLCCEEGENGYDPKVLGNVFTYTVEDEDQLTPDFLKKLEKQYRPKQVIVEYNGMGAWGSYTAKDCPPTGYSIRSCAWWTPRPLRCI